MPASQGGKPCRILSLDGGGTFALIQAKVLEDLYPGQSGHEVLGHFDLVAACSGGAIVAAALFEGYRPKEILELFLDRQNRQELFSSLRWYRRLIRLMSGRVTQDPFGPRFSTGDKLAFLHRILPGTGTVPLPGLAERIGGPDLLVVSYDYDRDRARLLRSQPASPAANFPRLADGTTLAQAAHASSTAPINWFDRPAEFHGRRYWDGAMTGYNNPVLAGVTEALAAGHRPGDIGVLAIGTSTVHLPQAAADGRGLLAQLRRFVGDLTKAGKLIIADPPDAHTFIAHVVLGGGLPATADQCPEQRTAIVRMNPVVQPVLDPVRGEFRRPDGWSAEDFDRLRHLDIATTDDGDVALIQRLADDWMKGLWYNQPIRGGGGLYEAMTRPADASGGDLPLVCEIGHPRYQDARRAWLAL